MYYTARANSPVYSMAFNSHQLFCALDAGVHCLDFSLWLSTITQQLWQLCVDRPNSWGECKISFNALWSAH